MLFRISWSAVQRSTVKFECEITEWRYLIAGILDGRTGKGTCGVRSGGWGGSERMNKQKAAQNCVTTQPTASPCLSHIFAAVHSLIKNALSRKSTQTPASWRQIYKSIRTRTRLSEQTLNFIPFILLNERQCCRHHRRPNVKRQWSYTSPRQMLKHRHSIWKQRAAASSQPSHSRYHIQSLTWHYTVAVVGNVS